MGYHGEVITRSDLTAAGVVMPVGRSKLKTSRTCSRVAEGANFSKANTFKGRN